jgi:hypothetical protein
MNNIKNNLNYIAFLAMAILNYVSIIILVKYAIFGGLKVWLLMFITIATVFYGFICLTIGRDKLFVAKVKK